MLLLTSARFCERRFFRYLATFCLRVMAGQYCTADSTLGTTGTIGTAVLNAMLLQPRTWPCGTDGTAGTDGTEMEGTASICGTDAQEAGVGTQGIEADTVVASSENRPSLSSSNRLEMESTFVASSFSWKTSWSPNKNASRSTSSDGIRAS